jgi:phosphate:Na+ symporter
MKLIGDYERIADHAVNILESSEEMKSKDVMFSEDAAHEYSMISDAVTEILELSFQAFSKDDFHSARKTEPLEQVIDKLKEDLRTRHFIRLQNRECSVAAGFVWSDLLTNLERVSDHCSSISGCVLDTAGRNMNMHENQRIIRDTKEDYEQQYNMYLAMYCG